MRHRHCTPIEAHVQALVLLALQAILTGIAGPARRNGDAVADRESRYGGPQRLDGPGDFVTEDHRLPHPHGAETPMIEIKHIRSPDTAGLDRDLDLGPAGRRGVALLA